MWDALEIIGIFKMFTFKFYSDFRKLHELGSYSVLNSFYVYGMFRFGRSLKFQNIKI